MKCVQAGWSLLEHCRTFTYTSQGLVVFYVVPTIELRSRIVANRIDKTIAASPYYTFLMDQAREMTRRGKESPDAVVMKQIGRGSVYFVASNAEASFAEAACDVLIIDEVDRCKQSALDYAEDRLGASEVQAVHMISNPTTENRGIGLEMEHTDFKEWHIRHDCGNWQTLDFFLDVVREIDDGRFKLRIDDDGKGDAGIQCRKCSRPMYRFSDGEWVPRFPGRGDASGYQVGQLFAGRYSVKRMFRDWTRALGNPGKTQRFINSVLGQTHTAEDAQLSDRILDRLVQEYPQADSSERAVSGVDIGKDHLHCVTIEPGKLKRVGGEWIGQAKVIKIREFIGPDCWDKLRNWLIATRSIAVIDMYPETYQARAFQSTMGKGRVFLAEHSVGVASKQAIRMDPKTSVLTYSKTESMDESHSFLVRGLVALPRGSSSIPEFYPQMKALTRTQEVKGDGSFQNIWANGNKADHYRASFNFAILALRVLFERPSTWVHQS